MTYHIDEGRSNVRRDATPAPQVPADVRYYTSRPLRVAMSTQILPMLLMLPVIILAPEMGLVVVVTALAMAWWTHASFRFELTAREMRVRSQPFASVATIPLRDIALVEALDEAGRPLTWGRNAAVGHLRLLLRDGAEMYVVGLADPAESADAVRVLQKELEQGAA
jgi:hypothetical protein